MIIVTSVKIFSCTSNDKNAKTHLFLLSLGVLSNCKNSFLVVAFEILSIFRRQVKLPIMCNSLHYCLMTLYLHEQVCCKVGIMRPLTKV